MQLRPVQKYQMPFQIDGQSAHGMNGLLRGSRGSAGMPQSHPDPGHQLRSGERLGQIIVCAAIQRGGFFVVLIPGGDHDDGHLRPLPHLFDDLHAVKIRQSQIQQHQVNLIGYQLGQRPLGVSGSQTGKALLLQGVGNKVADLGIVLHNQNPFTSQRLLPPSVAG